MLHMFQTYVACVLFGCCVWLQWVSSAFKVFSEHVSSVSTVFRRMLQLLYLDILKVDQVLHLSSPLSAASSLPALARHPYDAVAGSFQIEGAARPTPLVA
jgi:hypothetical protein